MADANDDGAGRASRAAIGVPPYKALATLDRAHLEVEVTKLKLACGMRRVAEFHQRLRTGIE